MNKIESFLKSLSDLLRNQLKPSEKINTVLSCVVISQLELPMVETKDEKWGEEVKEILEIFEWEKYHQKLKKQKLLDLLMNKVNELKEIGLRSYEFGLLYEGLLKEFNEGKTQFAEFYTPPDLVDLLINLLFIDGEPEEGTSIYDPTCGVGQMLFMAHDKYPQLDIYGQEINEITYAISKTYILLKNKMILEETKENNRNHL